MRRLALALLLWSLPGAAADAIHYSRTYLSPVDRAERPYDVRTPAGWDGVTPAPAILFLHGRGGYKGSFQLPSYQDAADANGVVLVFWQGRYDLSTGIFSTYYLDGKNGVPDESDVIACLDDALASFAIDPARVHLAGFSQGGKGALLIGLKHPDRFASVAAGAAPTDAFQGQLWSPTFPDYAAAAGGPANGATGERLALWYAQSPRFFLPNARDLPVALCHGTADTVVPDSTALFPYRNTHHVADTPGFTDARGRTPTLSELHAADPDGYAFSATYPPGVGHDEEAVLSAPGLFAFVAGKSRPARPARVVGVSYEARETSLWWLRFARAAPPDGTRVGVTGDLAPQSVHLAPEGSVALTLDVPAAGLDATRAFTVTLDDAAILHLRGLPAGAYRMAKDGVVETDTVAAGADLSLTLTAAASLIVEPAPAAALAASDLLVPALVEASGLLDARFRTELVLANTSALPAALELYPARPVAASAVRVDLAPGSTRLLRSAELFAALALPPGAEPLRVRVLSGEPGAVAASARVFNDTDAGTYGLSFPVRAAGLSVIGPGGSADFVGGTAGHPSRTNLSLFAPFEAADVTVIVPSTTGPVRDPLPVHLGAGERVQLNDLLGGVAPPGRATLRVSAGRVQAYATVIDLAANNDPFRSPPLGPPAARWVVPAVAAAPGRAGARFTSDLILAAPAGSPAISVTLTFLPRGGGAPASASLALAPGETRALEDVLGTFFPAAVPGAGALTVDAGAPLSLLAVTRSDSDTGPASQDLLPVRAGDEVTVASPALFVGLAESTEARSNLVLVSRGAATSVALTLFAEDGPRGTVEVPLAAGEVKQIDSVISLFGGAPAAAGALRVAPRSGAVVASAVRIDDRSNDPAGLAP